MPHLHCTLHKEHQLNRKPLQVSDSLSKNLWPAQKAVRTDHLCCLDYFPFLHPGVYPHVPKQPQSMSNLNYTTIIPKPHRNFSQGNNKKQNFCLYSCLKIIHHHTDAQDHDGDKLWGTVTSFEQFLARMALDPNSPHSIYASWPLRDEITPISMHRVQL